MEADKSRFTGAKSLYTIPSNTAFRIYSRYVWTVVLVIALPLVSSTINAAGINEYDYYKRVSSGKERLFIPKYKGVPAKTRRDIKKVITQAYKYFGKRPIADTYALYWHRDKSNLNKVAKRYCGLWSKKGIDHSRCLRKDTDEAGIFKKTPKANAGFETASLKGLIAVTEGIWADKKNNHHAKVTAHEYFHVYQGMMKYYFEKEDRIGIPRNTTGLVGGHPAWINEGGAEYFAYNLMGKYKWKSYEYWMRRALTAAKLEIEICKKKGIKIVLKNYTNYAQIWKMDDECAHFHYEGGAWAMAYLRYLKGTNKGVLINYYKDLAELERTWRKKGKINYGWKKSFQKNFGMTINQFYARFNRFMKWSTARQMTILAKPLS